MGGRTVRRALLGLALNVTGTMLYGQQVARAPLETRVEVHLRELEAELIAFRRDLHQHPELSGAEVRTAGKVAERLRALGLEVRTGVGGHGVVGILRGGRPGPTVAYRADMDAVRDRSLDPVEFRSLTPGVRHICGHDIHTTVGLALAAGLTSVRAELPGTVVFLFQPAEERATGAKSMLRDGALAGLSPVAIYALHTAPYEVGQLGTRAGGLLASRDHATIRLTGSGDLTVAGAAVERMLRQASTLPQGSRFVEADPETFTLIEWHSEPEGAGRIVYQADIVLASVAVRERLRARLTRELASLGVPNIGAVLDYQAGVTAGVTNDPGLVTRGNAAIRSALGDSAVRLTVSVLPAFSEDFGEFQRTVPGVMYFLGVSNTARGTAGMPHAPNYVADEGSILIGARAMASVVLSQLAGH
jgi:metal-dependent amidase/aminoacylase/carboxypeptidase family protein